MDQDKKTNLNLLHEQLVKDNYAVPKDYKAFEDTFSNPENAKALHDQLVSDSYAVPDDYDSFVNEFGLKKKDVYEIFGFGRNLHKEVFGENPEEPVSKKPSGFKKSTLSDKDEKDFQKWMGIHTDSEDYDIRGFWESEKELGVLKPTRADYFKEDPNWHDYSIGIDGRILKAPWHSTFHKTEEGEESLGNEIYLDDNDILRSRPKKQKIDPKYSLKTPKSPIVSDHSVSDAMNKAMRTPEKEKPDLSIPDTTLDKLELKFPDNNVNDVLYDAFRKPLKVKENPTFMDYVTALPQGFNLRMGEAIRNMGALINAPKEGVKSLVKKVVEKTLT